MVVVVVFIFLFLTSYLQACFFLHYLILGPLEALVVLVFLYLEIGPSCIAGMGLLLLLVPAQIKMGRILMRVRYSNSFIYHMTCSFGNKHFDQNQ